MLKDNKVWIADNEKGENIYILPSMLNRHGLISGATGTGKTVTLKVMSETFSEMGVPVFISDVKGDVAGMIKPGLDSENMQKRIEKFKLNECGFSYKGFPVTLWDIYGKGGIQLRTTVSEMGPVLLARILNLNDLQRDILSVVFKIADDNNLLLIDTKDLKALLAYVDANSDDFVADYGKISSASVGVITRALVALESEGGDIFFGEPALNILDWLTPNYDGKGMIHILDSSALINSSKLYSTFLLWFMSELFENMPEVGDLEKPKMVFFFDEAHLLFNDIPAYLLEKIEQLVKLIRSKGIGIYFCTQNPRDIPDGVLAQLNNKIQHGLRAYTPSEQKAVKAAADSFRVNPDLDTYDTILNLGTGEAVVSFLDEKGIPSIADKAYILPPQSLMGAITDEERSGSILNSSYYSKYSNPVDNESAYEFLTRKGMEELQKQEEEKARKEAELAAEKEQKEKEKEELAAKKEEEKKKKENAKVAKSVGNSVVGTIGREVGKQVGKNFGSFGRTLGGNVGASLGRGLLSTLFKK